MLDVSANATSRQLGYAGEIAIAGQSAFAREADFGVYEVKTTIARDENRAMRLLGWREQPSTLHALRRQATTGELAIPLVVAANDGAAGTGLIRTDRMLFLADEQGMFVWRRTWAAFTQRLHDRLGAAVLLHAATRASTRRRASMTINRAERCGRSRAPPAAHVRMLRRTARLARNVHELRRQRCLLADEHLLDATLHRRAAGREPAAEHVEIATGRRMFAYQEPARHQQLSGEERRFLFDVEDDRLALLDRRATTEQRLLA